MRTRWPRSTGHAEALPERAQEAVRDIGDFVPWCRRCRRCASRTGGGSEAPRSERNRETDDAEVTPISTPVRAPIRAHAAADKRRRVELARLTKCSVVPRRTLPRATRSSAERGVRLLRERTERARGSGVAKPSGEETQRAKMRTEPRRGRSTGRARGAGRGLSTPRVVPL